jgi:hypothetical protein
MYRVMMKRTMAATFLLLAVAGAALAQDLSTPVSYMAHFNDKIGVVNQTYMNYLSAVSHGKSARKVEKLRGKVVELIFNTRNDVAGTPPFKGDRTLRDAAAAYFKTCYIVFNEDYAKIVNMEEIAEQSFDAMEAYMLAQEKANDKLEEAFKKHGEVYKQFAQKNNVELRESKDALEDKIEKANKVSAYYHPFFLIFFKANKQDVYLTDAINKGDINGVEQNRNALLNYATTGFEQLKAMEAFESDASVLTACKKVMLFYKEMTETKMEAITAYLLAEQNFKKVKKEFDAKPAAKRVQADIDAYNKAVEGINKSSNAYNKNNNEINKQRTEVLKMWDGAVTRFMDVHMPYAK